MIVGLVRDAVHRLIDWERWDNAKAAQGLERERLGKVASRWNDVAAMVDGGAGE